MKVFQIIDGFCHWDASEVLRMASDAADRFAPDMYFVDAPDYVFEGWGFNPDLDGDARFIKPEAPEGWLYDDATGTFYRESGAKPSEIAKSAEQLALENLELKKLLTELEEMLTETQLALCDVYENMILMIGG